MLKTTVEELARLQLSSRLADRVPAIDDLLDDARAAHWYRLLAWASRFHAHYLIWGSDPEGGGWAVLTLPNVPQQHFKVTLDPDGLPVRTPELEAALKAALESKP